MAELSKIIEERLNRLADIPEGFSNSMTDIQRKAFTLMLAELNRFDVDENGKIKLSVKNFAAIETVLQSIEDSLYGSGYLKEVKNFLKDFDSQQVLSNEMLAKIEKGFEPSKVMELSFEKSKTIALETLTDEFSASLKAQMRGILNEAVQTSSTYTQMIQNVRTAYEGNGTIEGSFERYAKQQSFDLFSDADRQYSQIGADEIGAEFFKYSGGKKDTTRAFCIERLNKVYHRKEIEGWGRGDKCCGLKWPQSDTWAGQYRGTNSSNIFTVAGGYNCSHAFIPVAIRFVPKDVLERAKKEGFYKG